MEKVIRDPAFGRRLEQACDSNFHCPAPNHGRLRWIAQEFEKRFGEKLSIESVRKWIAGEVRPRRDRADKLAEILGVDAVWLYIGVDPDMSPRERKVRNAEADGIVNVVAGFIQMDGGYPAFPDEKDKRATEQHIDLYAIIKGANYAFHVSLAYQRPEEPGAWHFPAPVVEGVIILGVVRDGFSLRIVEITSDMLSEHGQRSGASALVTLTDAQIDASPITEFSRRL